MRASAVAESLQREFRMAPPCFATEILADYRLQPMLTDDPESRISGLRQGCTRISYRSCLVLSFKGKSVGNVIHRNLAVPPYRD